MFEPHGAARFWAGFASSRIVQLSAVSCSGGLAAPPPDGGVQGDGRQPLRRKKQREASLRN
eukprot:4629860-Alexandrium_andersonii.AAC.1